MKKIILTGLLLVFAFAVYGQDTEPDPEIVQAKEETAVVYDLGRFFGYVHTMVSEDSSLELQAEQLKIFRDVMETIKSTERIEPEWADETLEYLELDVLTVPQLMAVDMLAIEREESRESGTGESKGGGTGSGPILTYVAGGAFNPIIDESKSLGEGFAALYKYVISAD